MNTQIRKRLGAFILCGLLCVNIALPAFGAALDKIVINGVEKSLSTPIISSDAGVLVSLRALSEASGMKVRWDASDNTIHCVLNDADYTFRIGSQDVQSESRNFKMSGPVQIIGGLSYVPLNAVADIFKGQITIKDEIYQITMSLNNVGQFGTWTFDELFKTALEKSIAYQQALSSLERAEIVQEEVRDNNIDFPSNNGDPTLEAVKLASLLGMESADISVKSAEIAVLSKKDELRYTLKTALNNARTTSSAVTLAKRDYDLQVEINRQNNLKYENGLLSRYEMEKSDESLKGKLNALGIKESEAKGSIIILDNLLKLGAENYGFVTNYDIKLEPLADRDLDAHIKDILNNSPDIFNLKQAVNYAETGLKYFVFNTGGTPYEAEKLDVTNAKQNLSAAQEATEKSLRTMYEQLTQIEKSYEALTLERSKLQKDYEVAKANRQAGLITDLTVQQLEFAMDSLEHQMLSLKGNYEALKMSYLQPWAAQ